MNINEPDQSESDVERPLKDSLKRLQALTQNLADEPLTGYGAADGRVGITHCL
jgi:hypothetical protein